MGPTGPSLYETKDRPRRDLWATLLYLAFVLVAFIGSIAAFAKTDNGAFTGKYTSDFYLSSLSCDASTFKTDQAEYQTTVEDVSTMGTAFSLSMKIWMPLTVVFGLLFSAGYLMLFAKYATKMVYLSVIASTIWNLAISIICFITGAIAAGVILLIFTLIMAAIFWWIREDLKLCGRLLGVSGKALLEVPSVIGASFVTIVVGSAILIYFMASLMSAAYVGRVVTNSIRAPRLDKVTYKDVGVCYNLNGMQIDCCAYETQTWAQVYIFFASVVFLWSAQIVMQFKLYVVADTVAQWYFAAVSPYNEPPSTMRAVKHGLTSSFGSISFAALILTIIAILRAALKKAGRDAQGAWAIICCIINCIAQPLLALAEQFTRFATVATAISGKAFVPAAKDLFDMLKRNFLATVSVWWVPDFVLGMSMFMAALGWACISFFGTWLQWKNDVDSSIGLCFAVAFVTMLTMWFLLHFMASLLLNAVDSVYICFAMDRDRHIITQPFVHQIFEEVPSIKGAVIEQPDGGVVYGAPTAQPVAQHQPSAAQPMYGGYAPAAQPYAPAPQYPPAPAGQYPPPAYPPPSYYGK